MKSCCDLVAGTVSSLRKCQVMSLNSLFVAMQTRLDVFGRICCGCLWMRTSAAGLKQRNRGLTLSEYDVTQSKNFREFFCSMWVRGLVAASSCWRRALKRGPKGLNALKCAPLGPRPEGSYALGPLL